MLNIEKNPQFGYWLTATEGDFSLKDLLPGLSKKSKTKLELFNELILSQPITFESTDFIEEGFEEKEVTPAERGYIKVEVDFKNKTHGEKNVKLKISLKRDAFRFEKNRISENWSRDLRFREQAMKLLKISTKERFKIAFQEDKQNQEITETESRYLDYFYELLREEEYKIKKDRELLNEIADEYLKIVIEETERKQDIKGITMIKLFFV